MSVLNKDALFHWLSAKLFNQMSFDQMTQYLKFLPNVGKYKDIRNKPTLGKYPVGQIQSAIPYRQVLD